MAIVIAITMPVLLRARESGRRLVCLSRAAQLQTVISTYTISYKGRFPSRFNDDRRLLPNSADRFEYGRYPYRAFFEGPLPEFANLYPGNGVLACPANQHELPNSGRWAVDYSISSAAYVESAYLNPELPREFWQTLRPRIASIDDTLFPSAKAAVYEAQVWHAWRGRYSPDSTESVNGLFHWGTPGRISVAFIDGHAEQLFRDQILPSVPRSDEILSSILNTTPYGMRGRDLR